MASAGNHRTAGAPANRLASPIWFKLSFGFKQAGKMPKIDGRFTYSDRNCSQTKGINMPITTIGTLSQGARLT